MELVKTMQDVARNHDVNVKNYSGRGMNGKSCVGVVGQIVDIKEFMKSLVKSLSDDVYEEALEGDEKDADLKKSYFDSCIDVLFDYEVDTIGYLHVYYWRDVSPIEVPDEV